jgi:hypothetical protein
MYVVGSSVCDLGVDTPKLHRACIVAVLQTMHPSRVVAFGSDQRLVLTAPASVWLLSH